MRALFISSHLPENIAVETQGMHKRMKVLISALKNVEKLDMLFYVAPDATFDKASILRLEREFEEYWNIDSTIFISQQRDVYSKTKHQILGIFNFKYQSNFWGTSGNAQVSAFEHCLSRKPDFIFAHGLQAMCPILSTKDVIPDIFFDLDNIEHVMFVRGIRQPPTRLRTLLYYFHVPALLIGERKAVQKASRTFVCSEVDQSYLQNTWKLPRISIIPNSVSIPDFKPKVTAPTLLLLGAYHYYPNVNAANFLIEEIWPIVYRSVPKAKLIIAGKEPEHIRSYLDRPAGVEFAGFVDDIDALYSRTRVVCCPILSGGGTRIKMIEAAAYGKAIVATRIGAEGLDMQDGKDFLLGEQAEDFANSCIRLLSDEVLCHQLGNAAREVVVRKYDCRIISQKIQNEVSSVIHSPHEKLYYA